jgi:hypothetical protein
LGRIDGPSLGGPVFCFCFFFVSSWVKRGCLCLYFFYLRSLDALGHTRWNFVGYGFFSVLSAFWLGFGFAFRSLSYLSDGLIRLGMDDSNLKYVPYGMLWMISISFRPCCLALWPTPSFTIGDMTMRCFGVDELHC